MHITSQLTTQYIDLLITCNAKVAYVTLGISSFSHTLTFNIARTGRCSVMKILNQYNLRLLICLVRLPITDLKL